MISRWLVFPLFILVLAPGPLNAQPTSEGIRMGPNLRDARDTYYNKMYEDIEIFRRILGRELQPLYPRASSSSMIGNPFTSTARPGNLILNDVLDESVGGSYLLYTQPYYFTTPSDKQESLSTLEGVYLKRQGVVYTATLASLQPLAKSAATSSVRWRVTVHNVDDEWQTIRRQILNEKEQPKKPEASKPPTLSDVLLRVLAENGHNFSRLGENESLTLVLTVHESSSSTAAPKSGTGPATAENKVATSNRASEGRQQLRDLELLGELHLKQGKSEEAIAAFQRLLEQANNPKQQAELLRKLAQCHLMQGQDEKARNELDKAILLMKKDSDVRDKPLPAAKPAAHLPVKLIISAPKKLLDQVKEGKITFEEFRSQAHVETLRFDERRPKE